MSYLLEIKNVTKAFGATKALRDANFFLQPGEIHALVGENGAGKSTLIKILSGVHKMDSGSINFDGTDISPMNPRESQSLGISTVFQELSLCQNLTVAENIFVNREPSSFGMIKRKDLNKLTANHLQEFQINIKPDTLVRDLNLAQKQIIEIVKAISHKVKVLILDEPTSALEITEVKLLFELLNKLRKAGTGIIFITHKLDEVFQIADKITVFRDGEYIGTKEPKETSQDEIVTMMIGRKIDLHFHEKSKQAVKEIMRVKNLCLEGKFADINLTVYEGEVLGISGLTGSGRTEVMQSIFGFITKDSGEVFLDGEQIQIYNPEQSIEKGIIYSPEDRKEQGLFLNQSLISNIASLCLDDCSNSLFMLKDKEVNLTQKFVKNLSIKVNDVSQPVDALSGGNQQKVLLAKCLAANPKVLIVDEPTRGIDIGSKLEIHQLLRNFAKNEGKSVILISSDLPEVISLSDRIIVFKERKIIGELTENITEDSIMNLIFKN